MAPPDQTEILLGLEPGDLGGAPEVVVWPENWPVVEVFAALQTQWSVGPTLVGLRYEVLPVVFDLLGVAADDRRELFAGLRVMEGEVLALLLRAPAH